MDIKELYKKFTVTKKNKNGYSIRCKKRLWCVDAPTLEEAEREARRYFITYLMDGEYN